MPEIVMVHLYVGAHKDTQKNVRQNGVVESEDAMVSQFKGKRGASGHPTLDANASRTLLVLQFTNFSLSNRHY